MTTPELVQVAATVVETTLRQLPVELREAAATVAVHFEPLADADVLADGFEPDILGLFTGSPRGEELSHDTPAPPQIILYVESLWDYADEDLRTFRKEVRLTFLHELGHYFGWDEDDLAARGLD
jgi:predicted Zn-dependent protease with MMP-like domain